MNNSWFWIQQVTILCLCLWAASAFPQQPNKEVIPIVSQTQEGPNPDGSYKWAYESGNGINANEEGQVKNAGSENEAMEAKGAFSYTGDDGVKYEITYVANEEGFQPVGAHIPTPPPIPEAIQKALEWNAAHPEEDQPAKS